MRLITLSDLFDIKVENLLHVHGDAGEDGVAAPVVTYMGHHNGPHSRRCYDGAQWGSGALSHTHQAHSSPPARNYG